MTFPRIVARYTSASFVKTKTAPLFLTILWPLSNLSGTSLNEGPRKHLSLELRVIDALARHSDQDRWELFTTLDTVFETIAAGGDERLRRSRAGTGT